MSVHTEKSTWLIFLILCLPLLAAASEETTMETITTTINTVVTDNSTLDETTPKTNSTKDLLASETADPKKLDIVKQIRRLNEDGSYTVGYEAGDGTFKIESRDVRGNIKGTFGYVDDDGEIKRVSYSSSNSTQSPPLLPLLQASRFNRTGGSSTTRRPSPTIVYPKTSVNPTRPTVIQAIPRRRPVSTINHPPAVTTTESYRVVTGNYLNMNESDSSSETSSPKILKQFPIFTPRLSASSARPVPVPGDDSKITEPKVYRPAGQSRLPVSLNETTPSSTPNYLRSTIVYDKTSEKSKDNSKPLRANTFRRQLGPTNYENEQMYVFRQAAGDDTTDVYGGSVSVSSPRPLFTTSTGRPRLVPIQAIHLARQKLNEKFATNAPQVHEDQQESTLEATTNKVQDENYVTSNPVPLIRLPNPPENFEQRVIERPFVNHHPSGIPVTQFRTSEFLRDNPGAPIPIGNQRILFRYNPNIPIDENGQFVRHNLPPQLQQENLLQVHNQNINNPQEINQQEKPNIIAIPVHPGNLQQQSRYQLFNPYGPGREEMAHNVPQPQNEYRQISTPVSTNDLRRLLHQLLVRQNRFQAIMDIREDFQTAVPPFQNHQYASQPQIFDPEYRQKSVYGPRSAAYSAQIQQDPRTYNGYVRQSPPYNPNNYQYQPNFSNQQNQFPTRNDYRPQDDGYRNDINNFDPAVPYEIQRFIPRRRFYRPRVFNPRYEETTTAAENEEQEYLPPDVREALLLKMLMLAIHPDFTTMPMEPQGAMTTPAPEYRKKVRNVQILGEESETKETEAKRSENIMKLQNVM